MINPKYEQLLLLAWAFGCLLIEYTDTENISSFRELIVFIFASVLVGITYYATGLVILVFANGIYTIFKHVVEKISSIPTK